MCPQQPPCPARGPSPAPGQTSPGPAQAGRVSSVRSPRRSGTAGRRSLHPGPLGIPSPPSPTTLPASSTARNSRNPASRLSRKSTRAPRDPSLGPSGPAPLPTAASCSRKQRGGSDRADYDSQHASGREPSGAPREARFPPLLSLSVLSTPASAGGVSQGW